MSEKIHVRLKEGRLPESGKYKRVISGVALEASGYRSQEMELKRARVALQSGDFELARPEEAEITLPIDYPMRDALVAGDYKNLRQIESASDEDLLKVAGIGKKSLAEIRAVTPHAASSRIDQTAEGQGETE